MGYSKIDVLYADNAGEGMQTGMRTLWNADWKFIKREQGSDLSDFRKNEEQMQEVTLPHDYLIADSNHLYEDSTGWYEKELVACNDGNRRYLLYFEGIYMDAEIYVNGKKIFEWKYGYTSFYTDITDALYKGEAANEILARVNYQSPNTRWYSGAGIYRDVYLYEVPAVHFVPDSMYVVLRKETEDSCLWDVHVTAELTGQADVKMLLIAPDGRICAKAETAAFALEERAGFEEGKKKVQGCGIPAVSAQASHLAVFDFKVERPALWNPEDPKLYQAMLSIDGEDGKADEISSSAGFREVIYDIEQGLFVNGEHIKLNGVCEHHDLGCLGAAYHTDAMRRKLVKLRKMGVNAIRTSHNPPASDLLRLTDAMGFLVMDEAFDMWERSKTTYDYARFFDEWYERDVASWIRRDRNHPSIILWSIGNEIYDTHVSDRGQEVTRMLQQAVLKSDPEGNAAIAMGSNYMPWENAQKCADILKFIGYNYAEKFYDEHHKTYPDWHIFGSETSSTVQSRGVYHFPYRQPLLTDDDKQCSCLGNCTTSWGAKNTEYVIRQERDHAFSMGQFLWTGFDYIGEPTPYDTKNSYFGQIDTAGFPKDTFYIYQAEWTDAENAPMVHLFPYWNFNKGQMIDVRAVTNGCSVALFVNGRDLGTQQIDHAHGEILSGNWQVPYEEGEITAVAYNAAGKEIARQTRYSFGDTASFKITKETFGELVFVEIQALDENAHPVEDANDLVEICANGEELIGTDNGDSTDYDSYKASVRRLFNGKLLAVFRLDGTMKEEDLSIEVKKKSGEALSGSGEWIRRIELWTEGGQVLSADRREMTVHAKVFPSEASGEEILFKAVNDAGITSNLVKVTKCSNDEARITALGDGEFRIRAYTKNGQKDVKVISQLECRVEGMGQASLDPYHFVTGALHTRSEGEVMPGFNNGTASSRDAGASVIFDLVDFGSFGSDTVTLPIYDLTGGELHFQMYIGVPGQEGSTCILDGVYQKTPIWQQYQEETYKLDRRVNGIVTITFVLSKDMTLGGFTFEKQEKAWAQLLAGNADTIYGDSFRRDGNYVYDIGNNVNFEYTDMDFGTEGAGQLIICGRSQQDKDTMHLIYQTEDGESREIMEFAGSSDVCERTYTLSKKAVGMQKISIVFLPGSKFDLQWIQFTR